jgi:hypothetical protein
VHHWHESCQLLELSTHAANLLQTQVSLILDGLVYHSNIRVGLSLSISQLMVNSVDGSHTDWFTGIWSFWTSTGRPHLLSGGSSISLLNLLALATIYACLSAQAISIAMFPSSPMLQLILEL